MNDQMDPNETKVPRWARAGHGGMDIGLRTGETVTLTPDKARLIREAVLFVQNRANPPYNAHAEYLAVIADLVKLLPAKIRQTVEEVAGITPEP